MTVYQEYVSYFNFEIIQFIVLLLCLPIKGWLCQCWPTCSWYCLHCSSAFIGVLCLSHCYYYCPAYLYCCLCYGLCHALIKCHHFLVASVPLHLDCLLWVCLLFIYVSSNLPYVRLLLLLKPGDIIHIEGR